MAGIQGSAPTLCQTLLTELPFYEMVTGSLAPGSPTTIRLYCPAQMPSCMISWVASAWGEGFDDTLPGCELVRVLPNWEAKSAGQGLRLDAPSFLGRRQHSDTNGM